MSNRGDRSAVDNDFGSGYCRGPLRSGKGDELSDFGGLIGPAERNAAQHIPGLDARHQIELQRRDSRAAYSTDNARTLLWSSRYSDTHVCQDIIRLSYLTDPNATVMAETLLMSYWSYR